MKIIIFDDRQNYEAQPTGLGDALLSSTNVVWVDMIGPSEADIRVMHDIFHFHPLAIEDTANFKQRPKMEEYPGYIFLIVNSTTSSAIDTDYADDSAGKGFHRLDFHEIDIFVGQNYVVTVHSGVEPVIEHATHAAQALQGSVPVTARYLLYLILDAVVDDYFPVMDLLEEEIDRLEDRILNAPDHRTLTRVFELKAMLADMWHIIWPHRDVLSRLLQPHMVGNSTADTAHFYLRDVSDHLLWIADMIATYRDTLTTIIDLYMSAVSNRLNRVVNRLTVLTLGFGMLAVITGFYGMNFDHAWPPFHEPLGVPFVVLLIAVVAVIVVYVLRRIDDY